MKLGRLVVVCCLFQYCFNIEADSLSSLPDTTPRLMDQIGMQQNCISNGFSVINQTPSRYCCMQLSISETYAPSRMLVFEYRNIFNDANKPEYTAVQLFATPKRYTFNAIPVSSEWRRAQIPFHQLKLLQPPPLQENEKLQQLNIYSRINSNQPLAKNGIEIRNLHFITAKTEPEGMQKQSSELLPQLIPGSDCKQEVTHDGFSAVNKVSSRYCRLSLKIAQPYQPNMMLTFDYRTSPGTERPEYTAVSLYDQQGNYSFNAIPDATSWKSAQITFQSLRPLQNIEFVPGAHLTQLTIGSRFSKEQLQGTKQLEIRNLRFVVNPNYNESAGIRTSYSAIPLFDWHVDPKAQSYKL